MAKFCGNCGAKLDDDAKVCGQCGTPLDGVPSKTIGLKTADPEKQKKVRKTVKLIAVLAAIVVIAVIGLDIASKFTGYNGLLRKVMTAYENYDIDTLVSLSSDMYYYGEEEWAEYYFEYSVGNDLDYFESYVGHNYKLNYDVQEVYTLSERKMDTILDAVESNYPDFDINTISQVKIANVEVTAKEGASSVSLSVEVTMTKENGDWKLLYID